MPTSEAESAVRLYLTFLADPSSLRDDAAIAKAEAMVAKAKDPIDRLRALASLDRARDIDGSEARAGFVDHAKAWAEAEGIPAKAFVELGVPTADLEAAGLVVGRTRSKGRASSGGRAPRLSTEEVTRALPKGEFSLADLAAAIGREVTTTRNYVTKLVADGVLLDLGEKKGYTGRGKAPKVYKKA